MFWKLFIPTLLLMGLVFVFLAIRILIRKNGKFPNLHIGSNKEMSKRGIYCATTQDKMAQKEVNRFRPLLDKKSDSSQNQGGC
ncbi:MAG: hypothetical protein JXR39_00430 [Marinilabiliaceae bacterium]|nr:hypothetical protein [Marinilabiliaceae bacterium]